MTTVAAVLVTRDSSRWIETTLRSVLDQTRQPDAIVVVDDGSTDDTFGIVSRLLGSRGQVVPSASTSSDRTTRIAQNFLQGISACRDVDVAVLGDHDDVWHPNRIGHQAGLLDVLADDDLVASDGRLVDEEGHAIGGTLRGAFPVPADWNELDAAARMRAVLRRSVATGGASALRPAAFVDVVIPEGWLHDRWWSLVATARERMNVDPTDVIDYRVSAGQEVGLDLGRQDLPTAERLRAGVSSVPAAWRRLQDVRSLSTYATARTAPELSWTSLAGTLR